MKKILVFLLMIVFVMSLASCGAKEKLQKKGGEALAEKIIKESGGGDVDIDGDTVTIKGEDGEKMTFGDTKWPTSDFAKSIPELKGSKVISVMEINDSLLISMEEISQQDFENYLDEVKEIFTKESYDMRAEGNVTYGAENGKGTGIMLIYTTDETLSITVTKVP